MLRLFSRLIRGKVENQIRDVAVNVIPSFNNLIVHDRLCLHVAPDGTVCGKPTMNDGAHGWMCRYHYYRHNLARNRPVTNEDADNINFLLEQDRLVITDKGLLPLGRYGKFATQPAEVAVEDDEYYG